MNPFQRTGLIASMEDADNLPPVDENEAAEVAATVADDSAEIQTQSDDIGVQVSEVEDAVQDGETLEGIGEVAAAAVESGEGLAPETAEVASIAIESIRNKLGFDTSFRVVQSLESFGNSNTKMSATRAVVEGISDTIKSIWNAVKAAAIRVWDMLKNFFLKLFNSAAGLAKHIASLRDRARNLPAGVKPKEKTLKISGTARAFSVKGKANVKTAEIIANNTLKMAGVAKQLGSYQKEVADIAASLANTDMSAASVSSFCSNMSKSSDEITKAASAFATFQGNLSATKGDSKSNKKTTYHHFGPFIDNTILTVATTEGDFLGTKMKRSTLAFGGAKEEAAKEIDALELTELQELLNNANKLANSLADWKETQKFYEAVTKKAVSMADEVIKQAGNIMKTTGSNTDQRQGLSELKVEVMSTITSMNAFANRAPALVFRLCNASADWASASIRNLQESTGK